MQHKPTINWKQVLSIKKFSLTEDYYCKSCKKDIQIYSYDKINTIYIFWKAIIFYLIIVIIRASATQVISTREYYNVGDIVILSMIMLAISLVIYLLLCVLLPYKYILSHWRFYDTDPNEPFICKQNSGAEQTIEKNMNRPDQRSLET